MPRVMVCGAGQAACSPTALPQASTATRPHPFMLLRQRGRDDSAAAATGATAAPSPKRAHMYRASAAQSVSPPAAALQLPADERSDAAQSRPVQPTASHLSKAALSAIFSLLTLRELHCALAVSRRWSVVGLALGGLEPARQPRLHLFVASASQLRALCQLPSRLASLLRSLHIGGLAGVGESLLTRAAAAMPHLTHLLVWLAPMGRLPPFASFQLLQLRWVRIVFPRQTSSATVNASLHTLARIPSLLSVLLVAQGVLADDVSLAPLQLLPRLLAFNLVQSGDTPLSDAQSLQVANIASLQKPSFPCSLQALRRIVATAAQLAQPLPWKVWRLQPDVDEPLAAQLPAALPHLTEMHLHPRQVTAATLAALATLRHLSTLVLHGIACAGSEAHPALQVSQQPAHSIQLQLPRLLRVHTLRLEEPSFHAAPACVVALLTALPAVTELQTRDVCELQPELRKAVPSAVAWRKLPPRS